MGAVRNERNECEAFSREEIRSALSKIKCGKAAGMDVNSEEFLTKREEFVVEWLRRI